MVTKSFLLTFEYHLDNSHISLNLRAEVELNDDPRYYIVRNIRSLHQGSSPAIPEIKLTKKKSVWVHYDSQKPTDLTLSIGNDLDVYELE